MQKSKIKQWLWRAVLSALLAAQLAVLLDAAAVVLLEKALSVAKFALLLVALFLLILLVPGISWKWKKNACWVIPAVVCLPLLTGLLCWQGVSRDAVYRDVDEGKAALYADRRVMLLVPHQDDDINVLGGVMEEYVKYGSEVYVVFSTNGDYYGLAETRYREALASLGYTGIEEDHVIFLGYGDQWDEDGPHLYNAPQGQVMTSYLGRTETYGTAAAPAYREGRAYTMENFLEDLESVILEYRPDTIYCVDYDYNIDHRALSHSFEKVMGTILKEHPDYRPGVFKGYAYNTAWEAEKDFYADNLLSAQNIFREPYDQQPAVYRWAERTRLPVNAGALSRSLLSARANHALSLYASQGGNMYGARVINGDKVFWQRDTTSLCAQADISVSSGKGGLLNDFMLLETMDLRNKKHLPADGTWIPEAGDDLRQVRITFPEPVAVTEVVLYDHPDTGCNVLEAEIAFDTGFVLHTGALDVAGAANRFPVEQQKVSSFTVTLTRIQGQAGLTEIEAFTGESRQRPEFIKLMDADENFVYDYWIDPTGTREFRLYTGPDLPGAGEGAYSLSCTGEGCAATWQEERILVNCPAGKSCEVTVSSRDGRYSDTVFIRNPSPAERAWKGFWLGAEETVMELCDTRRIHERLFVCRMYTKIAGLIR